MHKHQLDTMLQSLHKSLFGPKVIAIPGGGSEAETPPVTAAGAADDPYEWIRNERLLREEGAVYGLVGEGLEEKSTVIERYYEREIAAQEVRRSEAERELESLSAERRENDVAIHTLEKEVGGRPTAPPQQEHQLVRTGFGLLAYSVMAGGAFYATYVWLLPVWGGRTLLISLGAFLFGSLSLFSHFPLLLHHDTTLQAAQRRERWKILLEEVGVPLAAAGFIIAWGSTATATLGQTLALFAFLLFVFLFAGKGLLASISAVGRQWPVWQANRAARRRFRLEGQQMQHRLTELRNAASLLETKQRQQQQALALVRRQIAELQQEREAKKAYFASEYVLAGRARSSFLYFE